MDRSSLGFVVAAYAVTWVTLAAYAVHLHRTLAASRRAHDSAVAAARDGGGTR
ncbi:MAG: CcmD family protein [Gemmatimonadaceae bacterium]